MTLEEAIARTFADLIEAGQYTIDMVPEKYKELVKKELDKRNII